MRLCRSAVVISVHEARHTMNLVILFILIRLTQGFDEDAQSAKVNFATRIPNVRVETDTEKRSKAGIEVAQLDNALFMFFEKNPIYKLSELINLEIMGGD